MIRRLEHLSYEEKLFSLEKRKLQRALIAVFKGDLQIRWREVFYKAT